MNELRRLLTIWRDEDGQAMTEFVIVVPVVIFMFALVLQTVFIAQVSQMMNYAAFTAARSYATTFSKEKMDAAGDADAAHDRAVEKAEFAANLAMAPVSTAVQGEGLSVWNGLRNGVDATGLGFTASLYRIGEGWVISTFYRMKNFDIPRPSESDTAVVNCTFEYMCPIDVPGVAELWNYLFGRDQSVNNLGDTRIEDRFDQNTNNLMEGTFNASELNDLINDVEDALDLFADRLNIGNFNGGLSDFLNKAYNSIDFLGAPLNIRLFAKSAVGFEPWNGTPMMPRNSEVPFSDPDFQQCEDDMNAIKQDITNQGLITTNVCNDALAKSNAWETAKATLNQCIADNPTNHLVACAAEYADVPIKFSAYKSREADCEDEGQKLGDLNDDLANYECEAAQIN